MLDDGGSVKYINMFEFSIPLISERIVEIILNIYKHLK